MGQAHILIRAFPSHLNSATLMDVARACDSFQKLSKIRDQSNAPSDCEDENPRFGPNPLHSLRFAIRSQQVQRLFIPTLERLIRARLSSLRPFCCWSGADPLTRRFARP